MDQNLYDTYNTNLSHITIEGDLLPADLLHQILLNDSKIPGLTSLSYGLAETERIGEAINRSWQRMSQLYMHFQNLRIKLPENATGTKETRQNLLLPLFDELGFGRLKLSHPQTIENQGGNTTTYHIAYLSDYAPINLVGCNISLDKRTKLDDKLQPSPYALVQDFLNHTSNYLWGFVSNGLVLRVLRDNACFSRQAYIEFDLAGIFEDKAYADFALLWMLCHQTRVEHKPLEPGTKAVPEGSYLEQWTHLAQESALVALETLSCKVERAIHIIGDGFLHANPSLYAKITHVELSCDDYFHELLRLVYRLIFCFVAEDRNLLHAPNTKPEVREIYQNYYSFKRLRNLGRSIVGSKHCDLYESVKLIMRLFGEEHGCAILGLSPMGGFLWSEEAMPHLMQATLPNDVLLNAIRVLAWHTEILRFGYYSNKLKVRPIDYQHLGARELGSIYESLLESHPKLQEGQLVLLRAKGNERKKTGAYYTPAALINELLDSALEPVMDQACAKDNPEAALLSLKICDPACGSGHFLLAVARRLGERLAAIRVPDADPTPDEIRRAIRDVVNRCLYGVDINPMAVELCKVSLWMEAMEKGKPLSFLDHHIICGNSLLGTTPELILKGLPDKAFTALDGDDKEAAAFLKKSNRKERNLVNLLDFTDDDIATTIKKSEDSLRALTERINFDAMPSDTLADIEAKEAAYQDFCEHPEFKRRKLLYDMWCAAFVMRKTLTEHGTVDLYVTQKTINDFIKGQDLAAKLEAEIKHLAASYQFLHWDIAFPEVFAKGGFDMICGNPPWEKVEIREKEWFAARDLEIANAPNAAIRKSLIANLKETDPTLYTAFLNALTQASGSSNYLRNSGKYPFCGRGAINLYAVFAENMRQAVNATGRVGCIVPSGIATDDTTKFFFQDMVETKSLVSLYDFENKGIFPDVHNSYKFCLLTTGNGKKPLAAQAEFVFFAHSVEELKDSERSFKLSAQDIAQINPNTYNCPIFKNNKDAELTKAVYRRVPVLMRDDTKDAKEENNKQGNPWEIDFFTLFNMASDSDLFRTKEQLERANGQLYGNKFLVDEDTEVDIKANLKATIQAGTWLPLYEAKMIHHYNHRWATYDFIKGELKTRDLTLSELKDSKFEVMPRYWVHEEHIAHKLHLKGWRKNWLMGFRGITRATDERTAIATVIPKTAAGDSLPLILWGGKISWILSIILSSFVCDFFTRFKVGGINLNFFIAKQIPVLSQQMLENKCSFIEDGSLINFIRKRCLELIYTSYAMQDFAHDLDYAGTPFIWDEERRFKIKAELDALFFHLYLPSLQDGSWKRAENETDSDLLNLTKFFSTPRSAVEYIMETFPITKNRDLKAYNRYRTKDEILRVYDEMQDAYKNSTTYKSLLFD